MSTRLLSAATLLLVCGCGSSYGPVIYDDGQVTIRHGQHAVGSSHTAADGRTELNEDLYNLARALARGQYPEFAGPRTVVELPQCESYYDIRFPIGRDDVFTVLAAVFELKATREVREVHALALSVNGDGHTMQPTQHPDWRPAWARERDDTQGARNMSMDELAAFLEREGTGLPVLNETGLPGRWDFSFTSPIRWRPDYGGGPVPGSGLRLRPAGRPVEVLVIARVGAQEQH